MRDILQTWQDTFLGCTSEGGHLANERMCIRLPISLDSHVFASMVSEGWGSRPDGIPPLTQAAEEIIISPLLRMLNSTFGLDLCLAPCMDREEGAFRALNEAAREDTNYLVIGGSHAGRLADALGEAGASLDRLTSPGWKVTTGNVEELVKKIEDLSTIPDVVVIQALDNNAFFCLKEDGTMCHPTVLSDRKHHVVGELKVANKDQTRGLLKLLVPVLKAFPNSKILIVSCLPRYTADRCCANTSHLVGMDDAAKRRILADLSSMRRGIRSFIFMEKLNLTYVIDPTEVCGATDAASFADPVHLVHLVTRNWRSW
jgi:hypothetical protein